MSLKSFASLASGIAAAFIIAGCSESPTDKAQRLKKETYERQVMMDAKDRIDRVKNRFSWSVSKRSCSLIDKIDGTHYEVYIDATAKTSQGPAEFLTHGKLDRSKRLCFVTDFKENVHCVSGTADKPVCTPAELYSAKEKSELGFKLTK